MRQALDAASSTLSQAAARLSILSARPLPQPDNRFVFNERGLLFIQASSALQSLFKLFPGKPIEVLCLGIEFDPMDDTIHFGPSG